MQFYHPAALNMAYATVDRKPARRCWCWLGTIIAALFFYLTFAGIVPMFKL